MITTNQTPFAEPRLRLIPGASPLAAAFVVLVAVNEQVQGTGLPMDGYSKYGGQGSRAWSPPD